MDAIFLKLLNMSITASWMILAVLLLRVLLKKAPKWIRCLLWAMVAARLLLPISFESAISLIPSANTVQTQTVYQTVTDDLPSEPDVEAEQEPPHYEQIVIQSGFSSFDDTVNSIIKEYTSPTPQESTDSTPMGTHIAGYIWLVGILLLLGYGAFGYLRLKRRVGASIKLKKRFYLCDGIDSPFILGILNPRIYIPSHMDPASVDHVVEHEQAHLRCLDHIWKPLGYLVLSLHWFNPFVWLAYALFNRDIELACDEKVIKSLDRDQKAAYSQALLNCSSPRSLISTYPLAFGEISVKTRIKKVLRYKKPAIWAIVVALLACVAVVGCFWTDPEPATVKEPEQNVPAQNGPTTPSVPEPDTELTPSQNLSLKLSDDGTYYSVEGIGSCWDLDVVIPKFSPTDGLPITKISSRAFDYGSITSIYIPNTITTIESRAFESCQKLKSVTFEENSQLTTIGGMAFSNAQALESITIPRSVTKIGMSAFACCYSLSSLTFEPGIQLQQLEMKVFESCTNLLSVTIPQSVTLIDMEAFSSCLKLLSVTFEDSPMPNSLSIMGGAFGGCEFLPSIVITDRIKSIDYGAFMGCIRLKEIINQSSSLSIQASDINTFVMEVHSGPSKILVQDHFWFYPYNGEYYLFMYTGGETKITFPQSINGQSYIIHANAFSDFLKILNLSEITVTAGVKEVEPYAFVHSFGIKVNFEVTKGWYIDRKDGNGFVKFEELHPVFQSLDFTINNSYAYKRQ